MITPTAPVTRADVALHYDSLDFFYRDTWGRGVHHGFWKTGRESSGEAVANLTRAVVDRARIDEGSRVCDIGCGYGDTSWFIAETRRARVTGFTVSGEQQRVASKHEPPNGSAFPRPEFLQRDWLENDLDDDSIDAAVSIECVSHVGDKEKFFREIHRVLKPGGRISLCAWLAREDPSDWMIDYLLQPICEEGRLPGLGSMCEYRALIEGAGLRVVEAEDIGPRVARTWSVITRRIIGKVFTDRRYLEFLFDNLASDRIFALTILRLLIAYRTRAMGYALIVAVKD